MFEKSFKYKLIYIFEIRDDAHGGLLKIGDTTIKTDFNVESLIPNYSEIMQFIRCCSIKTGDRMLWNAKMRFGKTLSALELVRRVGFSKTIIVTHRVFNTDWDLVIVDEAHEGTIYTYNLGDFFS